MAQGDSELDGTGIETSITGDFKITLIKAAALEPWQQGLDFPMGETDSHWIVHSFTEIDYLETYAANPGDIYGASSIDGAAKNTFAQARKFLMAKYDLTDDEATTYITQAVDFGMTQLVDGNWGMQAEIPKAVFEEALGDDAAPGAAADLGPPDLALSNATVHWGYFSKNEAPVLTVADGAEVVVEMATHHACDDWDKMIKGDAGMESVFKWSEHTKRESFRGATGGGDGVHVLTGPIFVEGAEPGDLLKVTIQDLQPRVNPDGKTFGSNANAWWGFQARVPQADGSSFDAGDFTDTPGSNDETVTIYEFMTDSTGSYAVPSYSFEWPTITDPEGVERNYIKYPGTCVPHDVHGDTTPTSEVADMGWAKAAAITYHDDLAPVKIPVFYPASFCTPSTRRRRGRGAIAGQHARRVHGPRAGVARRRRLDPADAERRQP